MPLSSLSDDLIEDLAGQITPALNEVIHGLRQTMNALLVDSTHPVVSTANDIDKEEVQRFLIRFAEEERLNLPTRFDRIPFEESYAQVSSGR